MISKLRTQKIEIDLPKEDTPVWIHAIIQRVIKDEDYKTIQLIDVVDHIYRNASVVATELVEISDPVTGNTFSISGVGATIAIKAFILKWLSETKQGHVNDYGDFIEE